MLCGTLYPYQNIFTISIHHHTTIQGWLRYNHGNMIEHIPIIVQIAEPYLILTEPSKILMLQPLDTYVHPWYAYLMNQDNMSNDITYKRNIDELVWYQEYIYQNDELIGEIFTNIDEGGYNLRKLEPCGEAMIFTNIAHFESVCDAKDFVNQAGGL